MNDPIAAANRREFLLNAGGGFGALAMSALFPPSGVQARSAEPRSQRWHDPSRQRVKRVIWLFMHGGPSHVDLFDPKPDLARLAGQPIPESFGAVKTRRKVASNPLLGPIKPFRRRGQSGLEVSDFLPEIGRFADDLCVIRSMHGDSVNHPQSVYQMNTGSILMGRPSVGSWVAYGLGSENEDLPGFVVLPDPAGGLKGGPPAWGNGFLPASYQGVTMRAGTQPILHLQPPRGFDGDQQRKALGVANYLNQQHLRGRAGDDELAARIEAYELAFRMQSSAPELVDLAQETEATHRMYGTDRAETRDYGQRCLLARRMIERGVRFVQVYSGDTNGWDAHSDVLKNHTAHCAATDRPVAGLLQDLKQRGLWDDTLVIWGGEFGRMPMSESGKGRDHNPWGYTIWMAGGGVKAGMAHGATDPVGLRAVEKPVHIRNFHATLLHLLGIDHEDLSYYHNGLDERLIGPTDDVEIVPEILA
ncbi:DUF1501 domain-containing protein [Roseiconus nitratireducens]|uniref:DUF1501 domain-containing protein n=1 Tax=Roseiconus nitratireducens TaxID=2605748 RepID=A0A5M6CWY7_9BACT|nr:DUF1501 domain-containing protein [Roseiconus nitratireducens]KAA5538910.1 DUF1501 domain-containing protein [Roseiconus nitratireducens]